MAVTYIGIDGEITVLSALAALRHGRTAVTMGPAPILTAEQSGRRFYPGDELLVGPARVDVRMLLEDRREIWQEYQMSIQQIRIVGANGQLLARQPYRPEGNSFTLNLEAGPLRAEVFGEMRGKPCLLAFTSAMFVCHKTMICARAGAEGETPNTIASITRAMETGCEALQVDVCRHFGRLVLLSDPPGK